MMTHSRLNNLLIGLLFLAVALLAAVSYVRAEDDTLEPHIGAYAITSFAGDTGYESPGVGLLAEASLRWRFLELWGHGQYDRQHKHGADSGYTYGYGADLRGYVYGSWYVSGACSWAGYRSEFASGSVWEKRGQNWGLGGGYNNGDVDIGVQYFFKETGSPNDVEFVSACARVRLYECLWGLLRLNRQWWDQIVGGQTERWSGWTGSVGIGVRW